MTKRFCDLCGEPAVKFNTIQAVREFGEPHREWRTDATITPYVKTRVVVRAIFGIDQHETNYGGPPDLCVKCANELLSNLHVQ